VWYSVVIKDRRNKEMTNKQDIIDTIKKAQEMHQEKADQGKHMLVAENCIVVINDCYTIGITKERTLELRSMGNPNETHFTEETARKVVELAKTSVHGIKEPTITIERWRPYHQRKANECRDLVGTLSN